MKRFIKKIILQLMSFVNKIYPKNNKLILFLSYPDLTDNSFALYKYMIESKQFNNYRFIWLIQEPNNLEFYKQMIKENIKKANIDKTKFIKKNSIFGFLAYCKAKFIFFTHGFYIGISVPKNQIVVNLWHGMPLKTIGYLDKKENKNTIPNSTYVITTSSLFKEIMAKAFALPKKRVLNTGQPRCDLLFYNKSCLKKLNIEKSKYNKIIFWAPTYRRAIGADLIKDGKFTEGFSIVSIEELDDLNIYLKNLESIMLIKLHPMDVLNNKFFKEYSNIKIIKNKDLIISSCQLYSILAEIDILITDFSSIYIDFLLTKKPILFITNDINDYAKSRGFVFKNPIEQMPGPIINKYNDLKVSLKKFIENRDEYIKQRIDINNKFNTNKEKFSFNLVNKLKLEME